ncbi:roadblock/LC7 domain-containing protein [Micromonospora sp. NBC_01813]|uniref:roadblock/LC7 domain-containing protein n=1 Tax=Micromonospora sp. NBC_01813 TaxID=2975988 RepID=UPI002DD96550|nr:roadblock/LC7 domain-containing protein [Micromonospora sp. NBC_01813]WSA07005.1 roadblock/LC7 domain-containing protein [Micromonospora sp. NBC_01813]
MGQRQDPEVHLRCAGRRSIFSVSRSVVAPDDAVTTKTPGQELAWLLSGLVDRVPRTRSALFLSSDCLPRADPGLANDASDHLAAIASGFDLGL